MTVGVRLAVACVRSWTRLYTAGLPPMMRNSRRAEIDSDLWESLADRTRAIDLLMRLVGGIPDDIEWRVEHAVSVPRRSLTFAGQVLGAALVVCACGMIQVDATRKPIITRSSALVGRNRDHALACIVSASVAPSSVRDDCATLGVGRSSAKRATFVASATPIAASVEPQAQSRDAFLARVLQSRYALSVRDGQFVGTGAALLISAIKQSRFVLIGEYHGLAQTPEFAAATCHAARFPTMAIEEGPLVAAELERWAKTRDGAGQLAAFNRSSPFAVNIYNSREEFAMLQQCARAAEGDFHLWGLNQVGLGAAGLVLSRILETPLGANERAAIQRLVQQNADASRKALESESAGDLFMMSADDQELARGTTALHNSNPEARSLFASFVESHEINRMSPADYDNARRRERLMKTRFAAAYARAAKNVTASPKMLLKFGAYHVYRGWNPVHGLGIGSYVAELAEGEGAQSLHVSVLAVKGSQPIYPRVGQPAQFVPFSFEGTSYLQPLLSNRFQSGWTLFDLRPLRRGLPPTANAELATLVFGIDLLVVVPEGTPITEIR